MRKGHVCMRQVAHCKEPQGLVQEAHVVDGPAVCELCGGQHGQSQEPCPVVWEAQYGEEVPVETEQPAKQDDWQVVPPIDKAKKKAPQGTKSSKNKKKKQQAKRKQGNADVVTEPRGGSTTGWVVVCSFPCFFFAFWEGRIFITQVRR